MRLRLVGARLVQREHVGRLPNTLTKLVDLMLPVVHFSVSIVGVFGGLTLSDLNSVHLSHETASAAGHVSRLISKIIVVATLLSLLNSALVVARKHTISVARAINNGASDAVQLRLGQGARAEVFLPREGHVAVLFAALVLLHARLVALWSLHAGLAQLAEVARLSVRRGARGVSAARVVNVDRTVAAL